MLEEDMLSSAQQEQQLVINSEEIENYTEKLKSKLSTGCKWSLQLQQAFESEAGEGDLMNIIVESQTR